MRNPTYEQALNNQGVKWDYLEKVALSEINETKSERNQARLQVPVDKDLIAEYAAHRRRGDQFPPLVAWRPKTGNSKYILIDGNQRTKAFHDAGDKHADMYFVDTQDQLIIDRLTWGFNNLVNGRRLSPDEVLEHAISLVRKHGMPQKQAAEESGIHVKKLSTALRHLEIRETLQRHNIKGEAKLPDKTVEVIGFVQAAGEDVMVKVAQLAENTGAAYRDLEEVTTAVNKAKTHDDKIKVIEEATTSELFQRRRAESKGGSVKIKKPLPRDVFLRKLAEFERLINGYDVKALRPPGGEPFNKSRELAKEVIDQLIRLYGLGPTLFSRSKEVGS